MWSVLLEGTGQEGGGRTPDPHRRRKMGRDQQQWTIHHHGSQLTACLPLDSPLRALSQPLAHHMASSDCFSFCPHCSPVLKAELQSGGTERFRGAGTGTRAQDSMRGCRGAGPGGLSLAPLLRGWRRLSCRVLAVQDGKCRGPACSSGRPRGAAPAAVVSPDPVRALARVLSRVRVS